MRQLELLAPARNCDIGIAAIDCGADAVYIAGPAFGARQAAGNDIGEIERLCRYARRFGARIFVTLNTILYDTELDEARRLLLEFQEAGADAVIAQDFALLNIAAESGLRIPLHASTQCAIRTPEQAAFHEALGFSRLVLERELSLEQIRSIREAVSCELEFFIHGALCVCYSGQCYLSEEIAGRSANRGACIQACRSRYDLLDRDGRRLVRDKALLSLKDLNLKDRLAELADAGITSFKIEGRLKNASYVKNVVRDCSEELDRIVAADSGYCRSSFGKVRGGFTPDTEKTFNRGYTQLFIDGSRNNGKGDNGSGNRIDGRRMRAGGWAAMDSAKSMGEEVGTVVSVRSSGGGRRGGQTLPTEGTGESMRIRITPAKSGVSLHNGDGFTFIRGSEVIGFRGDVCDGLEISCRKINGLTPGTKLYRNLDSMFEKELETGMPKREIDVKVDIKIIRDSGLKLTVNAESEDGRKASFETGEWQEEAENRDRMLSMMRSQLEKTAGHYRFRIGDISGAESVPFMSAADLNGIRRRLAESLDKMPTGRRPLMTVDIKAALDEASADASKIPGKPDSAGYSANISNASAREIYESLGVKVESMAYETAHVPGAELMRSRYCIRHELGICPKQKKGQTSGPLYLLNNGRRLILEFDCRNCEMTVRSGNK